MKKKMMKIAEISLAFLAAIGITNQYSLLANAQIASPSITSFCSDAYYSCAVFDNKKIKCWGFPSVWRQLNPVALGDQPNELGDNLPYLSVINTPSIVSVACGSHHMCMKLESGEVKCIGTNGVGEIGIGVTESWIGEETGYFGDTLPSVNLGAGVKALDIVAGFYYTCIRITGNQLKCFGLNMFGQMGRGDTKSIGGFASDMGDNLKPINFGANAEVASVHLGPTQTNCVILTGPVAYSQRMKCWGNAYNFRLGYGDENHRGDEPNEMGNYLPLVDLGAESRVKQVSIGVEHTCALIINGVLKCWGAGEEGQLGSGSIDWIKSTGDSLPAVKIDAGKTIKSISAGNYHTCILYDDELTMKCFGANWAGNLGQGDKKKRGHTPTTIVPKINPIKLGTGSLKIKNIYASWDSTCALFENSLMKCFGDNEYGELLVGHNRGIGDGPGEMGSKLKYAQMFSPVTICNYPQKSACQADIDCIWAPVGEDPAQCVIFNCNYLKTKKSCETQKSRCAWKGEICVAK